MKSVVSRQSRDTSIPFDDYLAERAALIESFLDECVPGEDTPPETISRAVRYSLFAGGKRMRPILVLACADVLMCGFPSGKTSSTRVPIASLLHVVPRSRRATKRAVLGVSLRKKRSRGAVLFAIQRSRSPSPSQSTVAGLRASSTKSNPVMAETVAKRPPRVLRNAQLRSHPLSVPPSRIN